MKTNIKIVNKTGYLYNNNAQIINVRILGGEIGITYGHTPLLSILQPGIIRITISNNSKDCLFIPNGIIEVQYNKVIILVDEEDTIENYNNMNEENIFNCIKKLNSLLKIKNNNEQEMKLKKYQIRLESIKIFKENTKYYNSSK